MSKHKPWNLEIYRGFDSDFNEDQLLVNHPIREFTRTLCNWYWIQKISK